MPAMVCMCEWLPLRCGRYPKAKSLSRVACAPNHAFSSDTMYFGSSLHQPDGDQFPSM